MGSRNKVGADVREIARRYTADALDTLDGIMRDPKELALARIRAAEILLDRGYGKPAQALSVDADIHDRAPRIIQVVSGPTIPTAAPPGYSAPVEPQPQPIRPAVPAPSARAPSAQTVRICNPYGERGTRVIPAAEFDPARHELADGPTAFAVNMPGL